MEIKEITNKDIWEGLLRGVEEKTFLQSWHWGEFQKMMGQKIWRLGVSGGLSSANSGQLLVVALVIKIKAKRGRFLFIPHGPIVKSFKIDRSSYFETFLKVLLKRIKQIAKEENCSFIRISPVWERSQENVKIFRDLGFRQAPIHIHPELTWQLDLGPSENELLINMRKTTRYLIKQGLKNKDLEILKSQNVKDIEIFAQIYKETATRHHFVPFSLNYLKKEFLAFSRDPSASSRSKSEALYYEASPQDDSGAVIFLAKYKGEVAAAAMIIFWQGIGFYHQGASIQKYSKIPASYLLQWEAIKEAKNRGCKTYNFWGVADVKSEKELSKHPWKGLSLFKKGFGGYPKAYAKTQDLPLSRRYWLTYIFEKLRKTKRGF